MIFGTILLSNNNRYVDADGKLPERPKGDNVFDWFRPRYNYFVMSFKNWHFMQGRNRDTYLLDISIKP